MLDPAELLAVTEMYMEAVRLHQADATTQTADQVTVARLRIDQTLIEAGWIPPLDRMSANARDELLLQQHPGWLDDPTSNLG